jgi:hypothetical protein
MTIPGEPGTTKIKDEESFCTSYIIIRVSEKLSSHENRHQKEIRIWRHSCLFVIENSLSNVTVGACNELKDIANDPNDTVSRVCRNVWEFLDHATIRPRGTRLLTRCMNKYFAGCAGRLCVRDIRSRHGLHPRHDCQPFRYTYELPVFWHFAGVGSASAV